MHDVQWLFTMPPWVTAPGIGSPDVARHQLSMGVKLGEPGAADFHSIFIPAVQRYVQR
jgi:hypothetical protein